MFETCFTPKINNDESFSDKLNPNQKEWREEIAQKFLEQISDDPAEHLKSLKNNSNIDINEEFLETCIASLEEFIDKNCVGDFINEEACVKLFTPKSKVGDEYVDSEECIESSCDENPVTCVSKCTTRQKENEECNGTDKRCESALVCTEQGDRSFKCMKREEPKDVEEPTKVTEPKVGDACTIIENAKTECGYPSFTGLYCKADTLKCAEVQIVELEEVCVEGFYNSRALCKDEGSLNYCAQEAGESSGICKVKAKLGEDCGATAYQCDWESVCNLNVAGDIAQKAVCKEWLELNDACPESTFDGACNISSQLSCKVGTCQDFNVEEMYTTTEN